MSATNPGQEPAVSDSLKRLSSQVDIAKPSQLLGMLAVSDTDKQSQTPEELAAALEDLLTAPVGASLLGPENAPTDDAYATPPYVPSTFRSLQDLLHHSSPDVQLLDQVKRTVKLHIDHQASEVPKDVATVIYYAAIASGLTRCGRRITTLSDNELRQGLRWVLDRGWVDEKTNRLARQALDAVERDSHPESG